MVASGIKELELLAGIDWWTVAGEAGGGRDVMVEP